jgi:4-amino-4-deoxy-L-arabinose transferase-like glycosyltransferase
MPESAIAHRSHATTADVSNGVSFSANGVWPIFWAALLVRVAYMTLAHTYRIHPYEDHFEFGWEAARIARSLVTGHGYADPFIFGDTGPTAWLPPLYPLLIAGCFKLFGVYTPLAAWAVLALNCVFSAATAPAICEIAARCFNRKLAVWSGWLWALYPAAMQYSVKWAWEISLTTMLFIWAVAIALRVRRIGEPNDALVVEPAPQPIRLWLLFGLLWGLIALSNPSLLLFLPVCGIWMLLGTQRKSSALAKSLSAAAIFLALLAPWVWRNRTVFRAFVPIRGNFGAEFYYGNLPSADGFQWGWIVVAKTDLDRYTQLGEYRYVHELGEKANANIRQNPSHFAELILKRIYFYWVSVPRPQDKSPFAEYFREFHFCFLSITGVFGLALALKHRVSAAPLFAWAFVLLPLTYYFVTVSARFRHPLEPLIVIFTVYLFQSAGRGPTERQLNFGNV